MSSKRDEYESRALEEAKRYMSDPANPEVGTVYALLAINETLKDLKLTLIHGVRVVNK